MKFKGYTFNTLDEFEALIVTLKMYSDAHDHIEFVTSLPIMTKDGKYAFIWPLIEDVESIYDTALAEYSTPQILEVGIDFDYPEDF